MPLDQAVVTAEMFVAFSKKSPCRSLAEIGKGITELTTNDKFDAMLERCHQGVRMARRPRSEAQADQPFAVARPSPSRA